MTKLGVHVDRTRAVFRRLWIFCQRRWRWIVPSIVLALPITIGALQNQQKLTQWDWTAIGTLSLAVATVLAILQARAQRRDEVRQRHVLAFRIALMELWANVQHIGEWSSLEGRPSKRWSAAALTFIATRNLLVAVWVPSKLWYRITTVIRNIEVYATRVDDAVTKGDGDVQNAREWNRTIDLYLKQVACYLFAEMRRQGLDIPDDWKAHQPLCEPLAWIYEPASPSPAAAAHNMEAGSVFPPHVPFATEPDDPVYAECRREALIIRARERHAQKQEELRATHYGWTHVPGEGENP